MSGNVHEEMLLGFPVHMRLFEQGESYTIQTDRDESGVN